MDFILPTIRGPYFDKSIKTLRETVPDANILIKDEGTWAEAVNEGFMETKGDVFILDDDIFLSPGWYEQFLKYKDYADIIGFRLVSLDGKILHAGSAFLGGYITHVGYALEDKGQFMFPFFCPHVTFSLIYIKRKVIETIGGVDESLPGELSEDVDYSCKAFMRDLKILYIPVKAQHIQTATKKLIENFSQKTQQNFQIVRERWFINPSYLEKLIEKKFIVHPFKGWDQIEEIAKNEWRLHIDDNI